MREDWGLRKQPRYGDQFQRRLRLSLRQPGPVPQRRSVGTPRWLAFVQD